MKKNLDMRERRKLNRSDMTKLSKKVLKEMSAGTTYNRTKNNLRARRQWADTLQASDEKLKSNLFHSILRTKQAAANINEMQVVFQSTDPWSEAEGDNTTKLYQFDYYDSGYDRDYLFILEQIAHYGAGYKVFYWWDTEKNRPLTEVLDTRLVYPDPLAYGDISNFRYIWFDRRVSREEFMQLEIHNKELLCKRFDNRTDYVKSLDAANKRYGVCYNPDNKEIVIRYHYTMWNDKPLLVLAVGDIIIDALDINPLLAKNSRSKFPVVKYEDDPTTKDPNGVSLWDIIESTHRLETLVLNLYKIKTVREALGGKLFVDDDVFNQNVSAFKQQSLQNKRYPVKRRDKWVPINTNFFELQEHQVSPDVYNMMDRMKHKAEEDSFAFALSSAQGNLDGNKSATQARVEKMAANQMQMLIDSVLWRWHKDHAKLWLDYTRYYLRDDDKKVIVINRWLTPRRRVIGGSQLVNNYTIEIKSAFSKKLDDDDKLHKLLEYYNIQVNDPQTKPFVLNNIKRSILRLRGWETEDIEWLCPRDRQELKARDYVNLVSADIDVEFNDVNLDRYLFLYYLQWADPTPARERAIYVCMQMIQSSPPQPTQQAEQPRAIPSSARGQQEKWWFNQSLAGPQDVGATQGAVPQF